jgi:predicted transposase YbfD/YdcC
LKDWPGLKSAIQIDAVREIGQTIRGHWSIENRLHQVLDVTLDQDKNKIRKDFAPKTFGVWRHFALNILKSAPPAKKRKSWNEGQTNANGIRPESLW